MERWTLKRLARTNEGLYIEVNSILPFRGGRRVAVVNDAKGPVRSSRFCYSQSKPVGLCPFVYPVVQIAACRLATPPKREKAVMRWLLMVLGAMVWGLVTSPSQAFAEGRVALVIGNGEYQNVPPLPNPPSDARLMAETLTAAGFQIIGGKALIDADKAAIEKAIREFGRALLGGNVGLFYYSGHGVQVKGENYLIPVAANISGEGDVKYELVDVAFVLDEMASAGNRLNIVILDACRNNPFVKKGLRAVSSGLAQVMAPSGTVISYATQPGNVAFDGTGDLSPFTEALAKALRKPGLSLFDTFNDVGNAVEHATNGQQQPWLAISPLKGEFRFTEAPEPPKAPPPVLPPPVVAAPVVATPMVTASAAVVAAQAVAPPLMTPPMPPPPTVITPHPPSSTFTVEDLAKQEAEGKAKWEEWQASMRAAFNQADSFAGRAEVKRAVWDRFLTAYSQKNPYSNDDELLRAQAIARKAAVRDEIALVTAPPGPPAPGSRSIGEVFRDCPECPEMVVLPSGSFQMGSSPAETEREGVPEQFAKLERPQHTVTIPRPFAMGKVHVTRADFATFSQATGYNPIGCLVAQDGKSQLDQSQSWRYAQFDQTDRDPVICVSYADAQRYIQWLNTKVHGAHTVSAGTEGPYRLPSEAEWEYAARANTTSARFWGNSRDDACDYANVLNNTDISAKDFANDPSAAFRCPDGYNHTSPSGSFQPNKFGLYDMLGNVWQWVEDCFQDRYTGAPSDGSAKAVPGCSSRIIRGGSWGNGPRLVRLATRFKAAPSTRDDGVGFRVARTL